MASTSSAMAKSYSSACPYATPSSSRARGSVGALRTASSRSSTREAGPDGGGTPSAGRAARVGPQKKKSALTVWNCPLTTFYRADFGGGRVFVGGPGPGGGSPLHKRRA